MYDKDGGVLGTDSPRVIGGGGGGGGRNILSRKPDLLTAMPRYPHISVKCLLSVVLNLHMYFIP